MRRIKMLVIAKFQTIRARKKNHTKVVHGSAQVVGFANLRNVFELGKKISRLLLSLISPLELFGK